MKRGFLNTAKARKADLAAPTVPVKETKETAEAPSAASLANAPWLSMIKEPVELPAGWTLPANPRSFCIGSSCVGHVLLPMTLPSKDAQDGSTECLVPDALRAVIVSQPGFPRPLQRLPTTYELVDVPGKGKGLVATRLIKAGTLIINERPFFFSPASTGTQRGVIPTNFTLQQKLQAELMIAEHETQTMFGRLSEERQQAYMSLANCHENDGSGPLYGRVRTNRWGTGPINPAEADSENLADNFSCVCDIMSRLNHSCGPNTYQAWDMASFSMHLYAVRDIQPSEELTATYVGLQDLYRERTEQLRPYGIMRCVCRVCESPAESDARRMKLGALMPVDTNPDWIYVTRGPVLEKMVLDAIELIHIIEVEGLQATTLVFMLAAMHASNAFLCIGDLDKSFEYSNRLMMACKLDRGPEGKLFGKSFGLMNDRGKLACMPHYGVGKYLKGKVDKILAVGRVAD